MAKEQLVFNRRNFIKSSASTGLFFSSAAKTGTELGSELVRPVRIGFVGMGSCDMCMLDVALSLEGVEAPVVCDIVEEKVERAQWITRDP